MAITRVDHGRLALLLGAICLGGGGGALLYYRSPPDTATLHPPTAAVLPQASLAGAGGGSAATELAELRSELQRARAELKAERAAAASAQPPPAPGAASPPPPPPCEASFGDAVADAYLPGCANGGGSNCETYSTLEGARSACATSLTCAGITQTRPEVFELRAAAQTQASRSRETSWIKQPPPAGCAKGAASSIAGLPALAGLPAPPPAPPPTASDEAGEAGAAALETVPPWAYWSHCGGAAACPPFPRREVAPEQEKFLLFETRGAGFNNERMSLEIAYALALGWGRTLVLPPHCGNPSNPRSFFLFEDLYDLQALNEGVRVMTADQFVQYVKDHKERWPAASTRDIDGVSYPQVGAFQGKSWRQWPGWWSGADSVLTQVFDDIKVGHVMYGAPLSTMSATLGAGATESAVAASLQHEFSTSARPRGPRMLSAEQEAAVALHLPPRSLLGNFYTVVYHPDPLVWWQIRSAVKRCVRLRSEFFRGAEAAIAAFGGRQNTYGALHNRQGDWQKVSGDWADPAKPEDFIAANSEFLRLHPVLYMATNPRGPQTEVLHSRFIPAVAASLPKGPPEPRVVIWSDVEAAARQAVGADVAARVGNWAAAVEMLICAQAGAFIGSWGSTFSGYIHRLRGYMPGVYDKRILYHNAAHSRPAWGHPTWAFAGNSANDITWAREYSEGFEV